MSDDESARHRMIKRMHRVDAMPPELRACVHEFGLTVVDAFAQVGVTKAKHIRHVVACVRGGSTEIGKREVGSRLMFTGEPRT